MINIHQINVVIKKKRYSETTVKELFHQKNGQFEFSDYN